MTLKVTGASVFSNPSQEKGPLDQRMECSVIAFRYWWGIFFHLGIFQIPLKFHTIDKCLLDPNWQEGPVLNGYPALKKAK